MTEELELTVRNAIVYVRDFRPDEFFTEAQQTRRKDLRILSCPWNRFLIFLFEVDHFVLPLQYRLEKFGFKKDADGTE